MKKQVNILVGICSCQRMKEKRSAVRETWMKHSVEGIECVFFVGGKDGLEEERGDTVMLDAADGYDDLPGKVRAFFRHALENYDFEWLFKCDDDTYLDLGRLSSLIDPEYSLIGDVMVSTRNSPSGGAGYLLKREMVEKLAAWPGFPERGAEDVVVGELVGKLGGRLKSTGRLYANNVYYPDAGNDMVTAHWCTPPILRALHGFNHSLPDLIGDASHPHWKDELHFYANGTFRRKASGCYGWWSMGEHGELMIKWLVWPMEQLLPQEGACVGSSLMIRFRPGMMPLEQLCNRHGGKPGCSNSSALHVHLGCGNRRLSGWLNLDSPNYDISRPLLWEDGSVEAYFLEHVIDHVSEEKVRGFFFEAFRSLKPGGILRLAFRDVASLVGTLTPAFRQYMKSRHPHPHAPVPSDELEALLAFYSQKSVWSVERLTEVLRSGGFEVAVVEPGASDHAHLQSLERRSDRDDHPFDLLGTVCMEARKPELVIKPQGTMRDSLPSSASVVLSPEKRNGCVFPHFKDYARTGNHLFLIAAVYAHALRHGLECRIPWKCREETRKLKTWLGEACSCCPEGGYGASVVYREPCFSYRAIPDAVRNGGIEGYFQSEKYFKEYGDEIRTLFGSLIAPVQEGTAGVHLRMGDYLDLTSMYHTPDVPFLNKALGRLSANIRKLVVFSDSPRWARELLETVPEAGRFEIAVDEHETLGALRELTAMQELILSCSTFSWWGAYLGNQDKVFIQKEWFVGKISDYQDVYRGKWIKI